MTEEIINLLDCPAMEYIAVGNQYFCKLNSCNCDKICTCGYKRLIQENTSLKEEFLKKSETEQSFQSLLDENKELRAEIESQKGLITVGGKQQYQYLQRIDELEQENKELKEFCVALERQKQTQHMQWFKRCTEINTRASQYLSALEEIKNDLKEICKEECDYTKPKFCGDCDCRYGQILNKINEVLNESK